LLATYLFSITCYIGTVVVAKRLASPIRNGINLGLSLSAISLGQRSVRLTHCAVGRLSLPKPPKWSWAKIGSIDTAGQGDQSPLVCSPGLGNCSLRY
jgi:hypothetical protein